MFIDNNRYVPVPTWNPTDGSGGGGGGFTPTTSQLNAMNSGITAAKVTGYDNAKVKIDEIINDAIVSLTKTWSSSKINSLFNSLAGGVEIKVVTALPTTLVNNTMYFVGPKGTAPNQYYEQKLRVDNVTYDAGTTQIDMSNYFTKTEVNDRLNLKQNTLVSGTNIKTINNESLLGSGNIDIQGGIVKDTILSGATDSNGFFKVNGSSFPLPNNGKTILGCRLTGAAIEGALHACMFNVLQESNSPYTYTVKLSNWQGNAWANMNCTLQVFYV